jgi:hypothetical protein
MTLSLTRREAAFGALASAAVFEHAPPLVPFGPHRISRLIVGGNPISGNSHVSAALSREMMDYFTAQNVKRLLADCETAGINTWQSRGDRHIQRLLREYRSEGGRIQWIAQTASELADIPRHIRDLASQEAIGIYHHGTTTDSAWLGGKIDLIRDRLKVIRDTGVRVGLGTHIPEVVDYTESKGWDLDFYMTCVYNLSAGEHFRPEAREQMLERVRQSRRQCLIFKIYGASRQCGSVAQMRDAWKLVARYAKPHDSVVIGMFPKHTEQVRENCRLLREVL